MTILVGRHFQSEMLPIERASKKTFLLEIGDLAKSALFYELTLPSSGPVLLFCSHGRHKTYSIVGFLAS